LIVVSGAAAPIAATAKLECVAGGVRVHHEANFARYVVCGEDECHTVNPLNESMSEDSFFSPAVTLHEYEVALKYLDQRSMQEKTRMCEALDHCARVQCWICMAVLTSPECNPRAAVLTIGVVMYVLGLVVTALCCTPLTIGKPALCCG